MFLYILILAMGGIITGQADKYVSARNRMVREQIVSRGITDQMVLNAMRKVPRHLFVKSSSKDEAYNDYPMSIGYGQTISQPYIVAFMTEAVRPSSGKRVLEIGTGSGYQAAILAEIVDTVYTVEIIPQLAAESDERLKRLGYRNIIVKNGDGYIGWPEHAPYDIIVVTAAPEEIPKPLVDQLAENGRLVIPVGPAAAVQELILVIKKEGRIVQSRLTFVRFVPFLRL